jgi:organic hydroperoxide reductase OsmC/OhrA
MTELKYTAEATADGNGRNGHVSSDDGLIDLNLGIPVGIGGLAAVATLNNCSQPDMPAASFRHCHQ